MKKFLAVSLSFALAGGLGTYINIQSQSIPDEYKSVIQTNLSKNNEIFNDEFSLHIDDHNLILAPKKPIQFTAVSTIDNDIISTNSDNWNYDNKNNNFNNSPKKDITTQTKSYSNKVLAENNKNNITNQNENTSTQKIALWGINGQKIKNLTIYDIQNELKIQQDRLKQNIQKFKNIINTQPNNELYLRDKNAQDVMNYTQSIRILTNKLISNHFDLNSNLYAFDTTKDIDIQSPEFILLRSMLGSRILYFDCINDAIEQINCILTDCNSEINSNQNNTKNYYNNNNQNSNKYIQNDINQPNTQYNSSSNKKNTQIKYDYPNKNTNTNNPNLTEQNKLTKDNIITKNNTDNNQILNSN